MNLSPALADLLKDIHGRYGNSSEQAGEAEGILSVVDIVGEKICREYLQHLLATGTIWDRLREELTLPTLGMMLERPIDGNGSRFQAPPASRDARYPYGKAHPAKKRASPDRA